jgi:hypothetical protein
MAGPVIGGIVGGVLGSVFGMGQAGFAVGWLIGSWLFGPDTSKGNEIFDPGANELPRVNQSLRGATIPVLFGTNRVSSNIIWVKNFETVTHNTPVQSSGGGSGGGGNQNTTSVSYTYKWDMLLHLGMAPVPMRLISGWGDTAELSSTVVSAITNASGNTGGSTTDGGNLNFDDSFFGIAEPTGATADHWEYFAAQEGSATRWPSTAYIGFKGLDLGGSARVPQLSWEIGPEDEDVVDVEPPYIIYQMLTNQYFGMGIDAARIDTASYESALTYCVDEGIKVSVQYTREQGVLQAIEELLNLYGGYLIDSGGMIRFGVQRAVDEAVRTIDNDHLLIDRDSGNPPVEVRKAAAQDGYNKVRVNFFDRDLGYRQNQVEVADEVDIDFNGARMREFPPKFVMTREVADKIAERALWNNLYGRDIFNFRLGWKDSDLEPGDVITLVDSFHVELSGGKRARIVHWREEKRGEFAVTAVHEIPYLMQSAHSLTIPTSPGGGKTFFGDVLPVADFRMYELPREFQGSQANLFVGYNPLSAIRGAALYLSTDGTNFSQFGTREPYVVGGIFPEGLPAHHTVMRNVKLWLMPASGFTTTSPTFAQSLAIDDISESGRANGNGVIIAGSEAISMEGITLLAQNYIRVSRLYRGWGGTRVQAHSSGAYWHMHAGGIFNREITENDIGATLYYKVVPYNFAGQLYDVSSVNAKTWTIRGNYWRPQGLRTLRVDVVSPTYNPQSGELRKSIYRQVFSGGCDVLLSWPDSARQSGFGTGGFGAGGYGDFTADLDVHQWRVEVLSGDTVVRSTVANSPSFLYTRPVSSADFNGYGYALDFRVTPFNQYGDALNGASASMRLFDGSAPSSPPPASNILANQIDVDVTNQADVEILVE